MSLIGERFGDLLVTSKRSNHPNGEIIWNCACTCGNSTIARTSKLKQGRKKTCGFCYEDERKANHDYEIVKTVRRRADRKTFGKLREAKQLRILKKFIDGASLEELVEEFNVETMSLRKGIFGWRKRLNEAFELYYTTHAMEYTDKLAPLKETILTDKLKDTLSPEDAEELTPSEELFCVLWVTTGSNQTALVESGFDDLLECKSPARRALLGTYLRQKPNLRQYIDILMKDQIAEVEASKKLVQHELIQQISQLKESLAHSAKPTDRSNLIRAIELLGRSCGAFEENINIRGPEASSALDMLLKKAKEEIDELTPVAVKELPPGSDVDEVYEVE